jgi:hypothetical protein
VVSLDGFMADDNDGVGPLFAWLVVIAGVATLGRMKSGRIGGAAC